ncbi:hypothetical protein UY3_12325 [Chelonia mydas]|uniref:Tudor domain-containing protein n=1 Tax=Chelonia mydas TaxID=8469 RepID=M7B0I1_CHEMY|nr:hypothetical protein UY3_12325 [Chelonia mydas]
MHSSCSAALRAAPAGAGTAVHVRYRARVEKVESPARVHIFYIDYGNKETLPSTRLGTLPPAFSTRILPAQAIEYKFAFIQVPQDFADSKGDVWLGLVKEGLVMVEARKEKQFQKVFADSKGDVWLGLVKEGLVMVEARKEKQFQKVPITMMRSQWTSSPGSQPYPGGVSDAFKTQIKNQTSSNVRLSLVSAEQIPEGSHPSATLPGSAGSHAPGHCSLAGLGPAAAVLGKEEARG